MPRLFTALEVPPAIGERLSILRGGLPGARWIDPENYHITLRFLGDVDDRTASEAVQLLDTIARFSPASRRSATAFFGGITSQASWL